MIRRPQQLPGQLQEIVPNDILAIQGGGAPRSGVIPSALFSVGRWIRQAYQNGQGLGGQGNGNGNPAILNRAAPGSGMGIAVLDLPVPPTKMPRGAKRSGVTGSPLDTGTGSGNTGLVSAPTEPWDARACGGWIAPQPSFGAVATGAFVSDNGPVAAWDVRR